MDKAVHFEIPADDLERAQKFYKSVFGWKMEQFPEMEYIMIRTTPVDEKHMPVEPGAINGGMMKRQRPITAPVITIAVQDMEAAMKNIKKAGGETVRGKMQVGEMGYAAYFKDTEGNIIGLWQTINQS
ncbi:Glyoxalase/Bleomycin resistance protein/Dioxygenase superfamily protein [uncultured archaeon]|nr:Glyoxalase/Bleomycin resistance protein/Dioxygenase superfamily protein [uncultured archaeon]